MSVKPGWKGRYYEDFEVGDIYRHREIRDSVCQSRWESGDKL